MKPLYSLVLIIALAATMMTTSCQKATLIEELDTPTPSEGRGTDSTEPSDTVDVTTDITTDGWAGSVDVGFEFG